MKGLVALACFAFLSSSFCRAEESANKTSATGNITLASQYVSRGFHESWNLPAVQGGFDLGLPNHFSIGFWGSNVSSSFYGNATLEMDLYGGWNIPIGDVTFALGGIGYVYPGANYNRVYPSDSFPGKSYDTIEINASATYQWLTLKVSSTLTDYFGLNSTTAAPGLFPADPKAGVNSGAGTSGSVYVESNGTIPLIEQVNLGLHVGFQSVANSTGLNYFDYRISLSRTFSSNWIAGVAESLTSGCAAYNSLPSASSNGERLDLLGPAFILSLTHTM